jgi:glycosyltransferase involved in cell wall biosynthesis
MKILQVSPCDVGGGAEKVATELFQAYRQRGHSAWLAVGWRAQPRPGIFCIPNDRFRNLWARTWISLGRKTAGPGKLQFIEGQHSSGFNWLGQPLRRLRSELGYEDFDFPATRRLLDLSPAAPDILHAHNLHDGYFDLAALPALSSQVPTVLTLHDAWLLSGHCAHSFECDRWKTGCGRCPDLSAYPPVRFDRTPQNWRRKRAIFSRSRLYVAAPSRWLVEKAAQSILAAGVVEWRVIPHGINLNVFKPGDRMAARRSLGLPAEAKVLLFAASGIHLNPWKDYQTLRQAVSLLAERLPGQNLIFLGLGDTGPGERWGSAELRFVPFQKDPERVAQYYQAADCYAHPARVDTFPNAILEALACGVPVVATAVGGIPEQIRSGETGFLAAKGDAEALAAFLERLLVDDALRAGMGARAAQDARARFDLQRQVDDYLDWYQEILAGWSAGARQVG